MKKLLIVAALMLALVFTVVACTGEPTTDGTTVADTTVAENPTEAPTEDATTEEATTEEATTEEATTEEATTEEATTEEATTEEPTTEEVTTEEPTTDPADPLLLLEPEDLKELSGMGAPNVNQVAGCEVMTEGKKTFVRLTAAAGGDPYVAIIPLGSDYTLPNYMAISYRTNSAVEGQFFMGSGAGWTGAGDSFMVTWTEGDWSFVVVDLSQTGVTSITYGKLTYARMDFFAGNTGEGEYFDVQYIGFFNTAEYADEYDFKTNPPYIEIDNADAGKVGHSFDTFYVNGEMFFEADGGAGDKLTAINNSLTFGVDDVRESLALRGWIGFGQPIAQFGYFIDNLTMIYGEYKQDTEAGVLAAGGANASRFQIEVPLAELSGGVHTIGFVAKLEDGTVVRLRENLTVTVIPYTVDETIVLGSGQGSAFSGAPNTYFGQRYNIGENLLKKITITSLATYADGNTNTWSFKIWNWNTDYATTVAATPLYETTGENHTDNAPFVVTVPDTCYITGDVYYEISYLSGSGCFTGWVAGTVIEGVETYLAGNLATGTYTSSITVGIPSEKPEYVTDFSVVFGEIFTPEDKGTGFDGNLILETNLGPAYFDAVRKNDWAEFKINVDVAGDYDVCMSFGWIDHTGRYRIYVDGAEAAYIQNSVTGLGWRDWTNTDSARMTLTEGEHTVRVVFESGSGPNVYAINFAYVEPVVAE